MATQARRFVTAAEACIILGISPAALSRRMQAGHLTPYLDPSDLRVRLIDRSELEKYMMPRPLATARKEVAMAGAA